MDQGAEQPEYVSPHKHAAALRAAILAGVTAAIRNAVADYTARAPAEPWHLDHRPGAADLTAAVDAVLDERAGSRPAASGC